MRFWSAGHDLFVARSSHQHSSFMRMPTFNSGFFQQAYVIVRDNYDLKERARELIYSCIHYAQYHNRDMPMWKQYNDNNSLDYNTLDEIFASSDILLTEDQKAAIIRDVDRNMDGMITKKEFEHYLNCDSSNRRGKILGLCFRDFNFLSNSIWFIGAIDYYASFEFRLQGNAAASSVGNHVRTSDYCFSFYYLTLT